MDPRGSMAKLRPGGKRGPRIELPDVPEPDGIPQGRYPQRVIERPAPVERPPLAERSRSASGVIEVAK